LRGRLVAQRAARPIRWNAIRLHLARARRLRGSIAARLRLRLRLRRLTLRRLDGSLRALHLRRRPLVATLRRGDAPLRSRRRAFLCSRRRRTFSRRRSGAFSRRRSRLPARRPIGLTGARLFLLLRLYQHRAGAQGHAENSAPGNPSRYVHGNAPFTFRYGAFKILPSEDVIFRPF
jgi:hypothetical protein